MAELKVFYDATSQPCRTVLLLLGANKIKYEACVIDAIAGETRTREDILKVCAAHTVPAIDDSGFHLFESVAIMKYVTSKYKLPDHWYPSDIKRRAMIDEYLHWHHGNMRRGATLYFFYKYLGPKFRGIDKPYLVEEGLKTLHSALDMMEKHFLKETKFINSAEITIADILAVCELTQFWMTDEDVIGDRPKISQWMSDVKSAMSPHYEEVHKIVYHHKKEGTFTIKN